MEDACIINKSSCALRCRCRMLRCTAWDTRRSMQDSSARIQQQHTIAKYARWRRYERGFGHASVYVTKYFDLDDDHHLKGGQWRFDNSNNEHDKR